MPIYDIFISHKKEQLLWATRLQQTFQQFGYTVFVDHTPESGLIAEEDWVKQLEEHATTSQYMIVLWSNKIGEGSYVHQEIDWRLKAMGENPKRRLIVLPLDESPLSFPLQKLYGSRQTHRGFIDLYSNIASEGSSNPTEQRDKGAPRIEYFRWQDTVLRFMKETFLGEKTTIIQVPFVIAAMTKTQALELERGEYIAVTRAIYRRFKTAARAAQSFDPERYGDTPEAWKPLPKLPLVWNELSISEILTLCEVNKQFYINENFDYLKDRPELKTPRIFVPYTQPLLGSDEERNIAFTRIAERPFLLFVDPLSLMHRQVKNLYDVVSAEAKQACIIGVSPIIPVMHRAFDAYRELETELIDALGLRPRYNRFHTFFNDALRAAIMNVDHGYELARWIQFAADNIVLYNSRKIHTAWEGNPALREGPLVPPKSP